MKDQMQGFRLFREGIILKTKQEAARKELRFINQTNPDIQTYSNMFIHLWICSELAKFGIGLCSSVVPSFAEVWVELPPCFVQIQICRWDLGRNLWFLAGLIKLMWISESPEFLGCFWYFWWFLVSKTHRWTPWVACGWLALGTACQQLVETCIQPDAEPLGPAVLYQIPAAKKDDHRWSHVMFGGFGKRWW